MASSPPLSRLDRITSCKISRNSNLVSSAAAVKHCRRPMPAGCTIHTAIGLDTNVLHAKLSVVDAQNAPFRPVSDRPSLPCSDGMSRYSATLFVVMYVDTNCHYGTPLTLEKHCWRDVKAVAEPREQHEAWHFSTLLCRNLRFEL